MKILQITPRIPYPPTDGGATSMYNITKYLALRGHSITLVTPSNDVVQPSAEILKYCSINVIPSNTGHSVRKVLSSLLLAKPYTSIKYQSEAVYLALDEEIQKQQFDLIHVDYLVVAPYALYLKHKYGIPIVLREHDFEFILWQRLSKNERNPLIRFFAKYQSTLLRKYEPEICMQFDRCVMITLQDERKIKDLNPAIRTAYIPAGVELPSMSNKLDEESNTILFLASLDWKPNVDGFFWFIREVLPKIVARTPIVKVIIVGRGKSPRLKSLKHPNVEYVGYVNDISLFLQRASVCIVPLFTGSGMRIKILEMLAQGKPIISTSIGCEGIDVQHGKEILVADSAEDFAESVIQLLENKYLCTLLGRNGVELVRHKYNWEIIAEQFEQVYLQVCNKK